MKGAVEAREERKAVVILFKEPTLSSKEQGTSVFWCCKHTD